MRQKISPNACTLPIGRCTHTASRFAHTNCQLRTNLTHCATNRHLELRLHDRRGKVTAMTTAYKWLPVINDYCHGCGLCVEACEHDCLGMVWDFATLGVPSDCGSEGICMKVCPQEAIHMEWVETTGDRGIGEWRDEPPENLKAKKSFWAFLGRSRS